jgi:hypothetical protein
MEFPEDADMKPPRGLFPLLEAFVLRQRVTALANTKKHPSFADC